MMGEQINYEYQEELINNFIYEYLEGDAFTSSLAFTRMKNSIGLERTAEVLRLLGLGES